MQQRRINVRGIVYRNGKVLAVKHKSEDGSPSDYWALPGGGVDDYESLEDAIKREFIEETGVVVKPIRIILGQQYKTTRKGYNEELEFYYLLEDSNDYDNIDLTKTSHGFEEIYEIGFIDPKTEALLPKFLGNIELGEYVSSLKPLAVIDNLDTDTF